MNNAEEQIIMLQRARRHLSKVVLQMPFATKAAYVEALSRCPHLVETESNPDNFLLFEKFNYWSAAGRLVTYWRKRSEYFGERAFLPMDLSGQGAMNDEDIKPMAAGCLTMLPNSTIVIHDRTSEADNADAATKLRRRFFFMQKLIGPCLQSGKGPRLFVYGFEISDVRRRMNVESKALIAEAFPIPSMEEFHLIFIKEKSQTLWQYILPFGLEQLSGLAMMSNVKIHNFDSVDQIAEGLACYGVTRNHLPVQLGGSYDIEFSSFVLESGLPRSKVNRLRIPNNLLMPLTTLQVGGNQSEYPMDVDEDDINWSFSYSQEQTRYHDAVGKGSLELLLDYFMKKAPDLPDVAEVDSLDPLKPFEPVLPGNQALNDTSQFHVAHSVNLISESCDAICQPRSVPMYVLTDGKKLSEYQCRVRQQIEFFEATDDDVTSAIRGRNKAIVLGQVGIRCRHCAHLPRQTRSMAATYYPAKVEGIYQTSQNLARKHLIESCPLVPADCRQRLTELCDSKSAMGTGKRYWAEAAQMCGVIEDNGILRFRTE